VSLTHDTGRAESEAAHEPARKAGPIARVLLVPVNFYRRWISPALPPSCRFEPSCSAYAVEALTVHGALRGSWLTLRRLLRCGPWHRAGYDPVPPRRADSAVDTAESDPTHHISAKE
jgi:putative membrane protein insertion efficiency factor